MRPYVAVFKDAFREAFASRILWLVSGLITLILFVGLAPFALREETAYRFQRNEFRNGPEFLQFLASQETAKTPSAARKIWSRFPESLRHRLHVVSPTNINEQLEVLRDVRSEFNGMIDKELYDPKLWPANSLTGEGRRLVEKGRDNLSNDEQRRFNRLLIDAAFPDFVVPAPGRNLYAEWFGYRLGAPLPFEPRQLTLLVNYALAVLMTFLAGILGVLIAILVTAPTVPQTFEPGAIDLLLSKPVSRSLLFLTKFFGASTFILLNSIYLIGGMWLIAGLRFDIWSGKLLLCIPVFLFLFVIYYSVSALTGVIWRNAIVCVCCTALFWGVCFTVGTAKTVAETTFLDPIRLSGIIPAGEKLLSVNRSGQTFEWATDHQAWEEVFRGRDEGGGAQFFFRPTLIGPIYDPTHNRIVAIESPRTRFELFGGSGKLLIGERNQEWRRMENAVTPSNPQALLIDPKGHIIVVSLTGIFRFEGDARHEHRPFKVFGVDISPQDTGKFEKIGPTPDQKWRRPFAAAMNHEDGRLAIFSHGNLSVLAPDSEGRYAVTRDVEVDTEKGGILDFVAGRLALATGDGHVRIFDASSLTEEADLSPRARAKPRRVASSPDGRRLAVLFDDGHVWLYDVEERKPFSARLGSQGDITAIAFSPENRLLAADGFGRVIAYRLDPFERGNSYQSPLDTLQILYRYVVMPLYTIFPKPGELNQVVTNLVVGDPIELFEPTRSPREELNADERPPINIWPPIISNVIFLAVVLTITCIYIERRDF
ncbi:MAG TPA: ABC transporter permease subunit [Planctomycetaceae bacterium]|nr:ABC transporter permease subunit [Planctomycetaceae bacterium]